MYDIPSTASSAAGHAGLPGSQARPSHVVLSRRKAATGTGWGGPGEPEGRHRLVCPSVRLGVFHPAASRLLSCSSLLRSLTIRSTFHLTWPSTALYGSFSSESCSKKMTPWTRFARLFLVSFLVLAVPTLYLLYPGSSRDPPGVPSTYEAGGIDSPHYRPPKAPDIEEEHVRDWQDEMAFGGEGDGTSRVPLGKVLDSEEDFEEGTPSIGHSDWMSSSGDAWMTGDVIMPKLGNATAK